MQYGSKRFKNDFTVIQYFKCYIRSRPDVVFVTQKDIQDLDDKFDKNIKEIKVNIGDVNILTTYSKDLSGAINEVVKK